MKVLFVADVNLGDPASGSERVLYHQVLGLAKKDMDVFAITRQHGHFLPYRRNVNGLAEEACYCAPTDDTFRFFWPLLREPSKLYGLFLRDGPFQAAVCHHPFTYFSLLFMKKLRKIPSVHVFHSPTHQEYFLIHEGRSLLRNFLPIKARWLIERYCLKRSTRVMVLSQYMKQEIVDIYGLPRDKIVVNPGGVDLAYFQPPQNRVATKRRLGFPAGKIHLLTIRNLEPRMGLDNLLKSINILKKKHLGIHLIMGGEGTERQTLENLVRQYGMSEEVTMTGFIPSETMPEFYGAADFFILPTRKLEGFGLVTVESMACGTPVLGTPVGGTKEILGQFDPQFLFEDCSPEAISEGIQVAVSEYLTKKRRYDELRLRCREFAARNYSWERHIKQLASMLDDLDTPDNCFDLQNRAV
jgi:glycosyltransferase involved in cell wall biosynthesis